MPRSLVRVACLVALLVLPIPDAARALPTAASSLAPIAGAVPEAVRAGLAQRLGPLPASLPLHLAIALAPRNEQALDATLAAISDPHGSSYHRYLTPAEVRSHFGPDPAAVYALAAWLRTQGLQPRPWDGGTILEVEASAATAAAAFHVGLWRYRLPTALPGSPRSSGTCTQLRAGVSRGAAALVQGRADMSCAARTETTAWQAGMAPDRNPLLPVRFAPLVRSVVGLAGNAPAIAQAHAGLSLTGGGTTGYNPDQIAAAYDFQPIYAAGYHGEHTRVALVELAPYSPTDITAYTTQFAVNPTISNYTVLNGNSGEPPNVEATMDIELLSTAAPGAAIDVYNAPNDGTGTGLLEAYSAVANNDSAQVLALTWVNCEPAISQISGFVGAEHTVFKLLAVQGTTVMSATGDAGAYACSDPLHPGGSGDNQPAVAIPASDPYVLAVGATDLILTGTGNSATIGTETAWSCRRDAYAACGQLGVKGGGSGGGLSQLFRSGDSFGDDLSWQTGPGVSNSTSNGYRQVPDVSFSGSYGITSNHQYTIYYEGTWRTGGGTSTSTPMWAALILLTDQYLIGQGGKAAGWINPLIYQLGAAVQPYAPYHDITSGNNLLYPATTGWDYASGWGSPDAWNVVRDIAAFSPAPTATPSTTIPGGSTTITTTPMASSTPTAITTSTLPPTATGTSTPSPTVTATPSATRTATRIPTPRPTATPICPQFGIGNGSFETGSLTCWGVNSGLLPHISTAMHRKKRYSVQLGGTTPGQRNASVLRQDFLVPPGLAHPVLHFSYWLGRTVPRTAHAAAQCHPNCPRLPSAASPVLTVFGPLGRVYVRTTFVPRRDRTWSGFKVALPICSGPACLEFRLEVAIQVPPQPPGVSEVLYLDDVYISN